MGDTNIEQNETRRRVVYGNALDGKPEKELFLGHALETTKPAEGEICSDDTFVENSGLELGQARPFEVNFKTSEVVEIVRLDVVGEETRRQAMALEEVVERGS